MIIRTIFTLLVLPVVVFLWLMGWSFVWIGSLQESQKPKSAPDPNALGFMALMPEEQHQMQQVHKKAVKR